MVGKTIAHYEILEKIGEGGMGEVYRARDARLNRCVAVKALPPDKLSDPERKSRFVQEARAASALNHPNIVTVHDIVTEEERDFIVMEYISGETLAQKIARQELRLHQTLNYAIQIADALAAAHAAGIVHRDLKPANVMVTETGLAKVLDFGLAKLAKPAIGEAESTATVFAGTAAYMSPEQAEGRRVDARSDIFSFGAVLYEMLAGRRAFTGLLREAPTPLGGDVPAALERIVMRCLRKHTEERYASACEVKQALEETTLAPASVPSIAVLPFANLSADKENEYFSDGLAEEIINALTKAPRLRVAARTSSFAFRGRELDARKVGAELNVGHLLEGSVRKSGDRLRVTAQLINAADGYHVWSERYDRRMVDVFDIQDEIAQAIVDRLRVQLAGGQPLIKRHTANPEAYNLYLKGRHWWNQFTGDGWREAVQCFEQSIAVDPNYALPHAGLAIAYTYLAIHGWARPPEVMPAAKKHALKARDLDETLAEAHCALGFIRKFYEWDWRGAEIAYRRAIELDPKDAMIRVHYSDMLMHSGRTDEALAEGRHAVELDPNSYEVNRLMIYFYWQARKLDEAIAHARNALELYPAGTGLYGLLGLAYGLSGRHQESIQAVQKAKALAGDDPFYDWTEGYVYARIGRTQEAWRMLERLERRRGESHFSPVFLAALYGALGCEDRAFELLESACVERDCFLVAVKADPMFDPLRADPRLAGFIRRIGLEA